MKKCYPPFTKDDPTLMEGFKGFIASVNLYLANQAKDPRYRPSRTQGQSKFKNLTIEEEPWKLACKQHRENAPFTDKVFIYYDDVKIWYLRRESKLASTEGQLKPELQEFFWKIAEHFDREKPWCGPHDYKDEETGMHYEARYRGTNDSFRIFEYVADRQGYILWRATCEGGFVV